MYVVLENVLISFPYMELFQISQHHFLMRLSSPLYILASLVLDKLSISAWVYFWALSSVYLCAMATVFIASVLGFFVFVFVFCLF